MYDEPLLAEEEMVLAAGECPVLSSGLRVQVLGAMTEAKRQRAVRRRVAATSAVLLCVASALLWSHSNSPLISSSHARERTSPESIHRHDPFAALAPVSWDESSPHFVVMGTRDEWKLVDFHIRSREEKVRALHQSN